MVIEHHDLYLTESLHASRHTAGNAPPPLPPTKTHVSSAMAQQLQNLSTTSLQSFDSAATHEESSFGHCNCSNSSSDMLHDVAFANISRAAASPSKTKSLLSHEPSSSRCCTPAQSISPRGTFRGARTTVSTSAASGASASKTVAHRARFASLPSNDPPCIKIALKPEAAMSHPALPSTLEPDVYAALYIARGATPVGFIRGTEPSEYRGEMEYGGYKGVEADPFAFRGPEPRGYSNRGTFPLAWDKEDKFGSVRSAPPNAGLSIVTKPFQRGDDDWDTASLPSSRWSTPPSPFSALFPTTPTTPAKTTFPFPMVVPHPVLTPDELALRRKHELDNAITALEAQGMDAAAVKAIKRANHQLSASHSQLVTEEGKRRLELDQLHRRSALTLAFSYREGRDPRALGGINSVQVASHMTHQPPPVDFDIEAERSHSAERRAEYERMEAKRADMRRSTSALSTDPVTGLRPLRLPSRLSFSSTSTLSRPVSRSDHLTTTPPGKSCIPKYLRHAPNPSVCTVATMGTAGHHSPDKLDCCTVPTPPSTDTPTIPEVDSFSERFPTPPSPVLLDYLSTYAMSSETSGSSGSLSASGSSETSTTSGDATVRVPPPRGSAASIQGVRFPTPNPAPGSPPPDNYSPPRTYSPLSPAGPMLHPPLPLPIPEPRYARPPRSPRKSIFDVVTNLAGSARPVHMYGLHAVGEDLTADDDHVSDPTARAPVFKATHSRLVGSSRTSPSQRPRSSPLEWNFKGLVLLLEDRWDAYMSRRAGKKSRDRREAEMRQRTRELERLRREDFEWERARERGARQRRAHKPERPEEVEDAATAVPTDLSLAPAPVPVPPPTTVPPRHAPAAPPPAPLHEPGAPEPRVRWDSHANRVQYYEHRTETPGFMCGALRGFRTHSRPQSKTSKTAARYL